MEPLPVHGTILLRSSQQEALKILQAYADFWKIPYSTDENVLNRQILATLSYGKVDGPAGCPVIVCPAGMEDAESIAKETGLTVTSETCMVQLRVSKDASVSIQTPTFNFSGSRLDSIIQAGKTSVLSRLHGTNVYLLSIDLVAEYRRLMEGLEDRPHRRFRIVSKLGAYTLIPKFIRDRAFKDRNGLDQMREDTIAPMECLRTVFLASIVRASESPLPIVGFWRKGKDYALAVTHDVETREGLEVGSRGLLDVEEKFGIRSTWNVPSNRYTIDKDAIARLAKHGELGGHDTKHDGKLILASPEKKVERLSECKETLEGKVGGVVTGFRSPLLQHNSQLIEALGKAGFTHDSSVPSWEPLSPTSLGPHGVGTVFPFSLSGIVEVPVSLPQDHQLLRVIGLSPSESVDALHKYSDLVLGLGGISVLLVHPDYELADPENRAEYERLLEKYAKDPRCDIMTLDGISKWWKYRSQSAWTVENGRLHLTNPAGATDELKVSIVSGYDSKQGFVMEEVS